MSTSCKKIRHNRCASDLKLYLYIILVMQVNDFKFVKVLIICCA